MTGTTTLSGPGSNDKEATPYSPELEPCHQIQFSVIPSTDNPYLLIICLHDIKYSYLIKLCN